MRKLSPALSGMMTALVLWAFAGEAQAEQLQCEVYVIRASSTGAEISPTLEPFRSHLLRSPLATFTSFELIESQRLSLSTGRASPLNLQSSISGDFELTSSESGRHMLRLSLSHEGRNLVNTRFRATPNHPFFVVVGSVIPRGTLVLGFVCQ